MSTYTDEWDHTWEVLDGPNDPPGIPVQISTGVRGPLATVGHRHIQFSVHTGFYGVHGDPQDVVRLRHATDAQRAAVAKALWPLGRPCDYSSMHPTVDLEYDLPDGMTNFEAVAVLVRDALRKVV